MLKGHVFKQQIFGNQIFALFINTFLDGANGISNNYKNSMKTTYNGSTLTVQSGAICIQGRFLEEDTSTDIAAGTDSAYCKLVIEIDLSKQNTESDFEQGAYKVIKSASAYPELTQTDIINNNSGVYQYELARFRTSSNGISDFQDKRTYLDFDSIYSAIQTEYRAMLEDLRQELADAESGSAYVLNKNVVTICGKFDVTHEASVSSIAGNTVINYPEGFNQHNTVVLAIGLRNEKFQNYTYSFGTSDTSSSDGVSFIRAGIGRNVRLNSNDMNLYIYYNIASSETTSYTFDYKITLMKVDPDVSDYQKGDVNMDGQVTKEDYELVRAYLLGNQSLIDKQFKLADMNSDGVVDEVDLLLLQRKINGDN